MSFELASMSTDIHDGRAVMARAITHDPKKMFDAIRVVIGPKRPVIPFIPRYIRYNDGDIARIIASEPHPDHHSYALLKLGIVDATDVLTPYVQYLNEQGRGFEEILSYFRDGDVDICIRSMARLARNRDRSDIYRDTIASFRESPDDKYALLHVEQNEDHFPVLSSKKALAMNMVGCPFARGKIDTSTKPPTVDENEFYFDPLFGRFIRWAGMISTCEVYKK